MLIAILSESGYEGFEESPQTLKAFTGEENWDEHSLNEIANNLEVSYKISTIEETNWNQLWESNFPPVVVDDFVAIRAEFHEPVPGVQHEIVITPKMSFGTGHHATTFMMIRQMRKIDFTGKEVMDFGTGTGILAILAEILGAKDVVAIDNDEWCITNAKENIDRNRCQVIDIIKLEEPVKDRKFGVILANINKHIILANLAELASLLEPGGCLLLSGLLVDDEKGILEATGALGLELKEREDRHNWLILSLSMRQ